MRPHQLRISHAVENLHWVDQPDGSRTCALSGWAYLRKVDLAKHDAEVTVQLRNEATGEVRSFPSTGQPKPTYAPPREDLGCDYSPGRFAAGMSLSYLDEAEDAGVWSVWLQVSAAGLTVEHPVTRLIRSGAAGAVPAAPLGRGGRLIADWHHHQTLRLRVDRGNATASQVDLSGRVLSGRLVPEDAARIDRVVVAGEGSAEATVDRTGGFHVEASPKRPTPAPGVARVWHLSAWTRDGERVDVLPEAGSRIAATSGSLVLETDRNGGLVVTEWSRGATADQIEVSADGVLSVVGRVFGPGSPAVGIATRNKRTRAYGAETPGPRGPVPGERRGRPTRCTASGSTRFPPATTTSPLSCVTGTVLRSRCPLLVSAELGVHLPLGIATDALEGRVVRGPEAVVRVTLQRPLGPAAALPAEPVAAPGPDPLRAHPRGADAVLFR